MGDQGRDQISTDRGAEDAPHKSLCAIELPDDLNKSPLLWRVVWYQVDLFLEVAHPLDTRVLAAGICEFAREGLSSNRCPLKRGLHVNNLDCVGSELRCLVPGFVERVL